LRRMRFLACGVFAMNVPLKPYRSMKNGA